ncbi:MAG: hypothetical protein IT546_10640 [Caulobacteraceae bacterium]|nr:hypothetical protein [Caulobacteraceae bacterium]
MRRTILAALPLLALAACQPQAPDGSPAPAPADAPAATAGVTVEPTPYDPPLSARGTEPFWALEVSEETLTLTRPDAEPLSMANPGMRMEGDKATWDALSAGARLYVVAEAKTCSDGMSDLSYPLTVEVRTGDLSLKGCGAKTAELPREGG